MRREQLFVSKRDRWAGVMFWSIALFAWGMGLLSALDHGALADRLAVLGISFLVGAAVLWFWFTTRYRLTFSSLHLHSGPFHSEIPLHQVRAIIASRKGGGMSYALSLESLQIEVEGSQIGYRISPKDRRGFMGAMAERCGHLVMQGEDLVCR